MTRIEFAKQIYFLAFRYQSNVLEHPHKVVVSYIEKPGKKSVPVLEWFAVLHPRDISLYDVILIDAPKYNIMAVGIRPIIIIHSLPG